MLKDTADRTAWKVFEPGGADDLPGFAGAANLMLLPDPESFTELPWAPAHRLAALPALVCRRQRRWRWTRAACCRHALARLAEAGYGLKSGLEVEFHIYRITDTAAPARPRARRLARPAARGGDDPPRLQPAVRGHGRHGRRAAAHRAAHRAGAGPAAAVAGDRTRPQPGRSGVRRHRRAHRRRPDGAVSQRRAPGAAPRRLPRHLHVPPAVSQHHVQRLAPAPVAGGPARRAQRLHARRARTRHARRATRSTPCRTLASTGWPACWRMRAA